jgi:hypothetical protein
MENEVKMLIAIGASVGANCQSCLNTAFSEAQKLGLGKKEILEAMSIGRIVRKGAIGKMDKLTSALIGKGITESSEIECPFGATEEDIKEWVEQDQ